MCVTANSAQLAISYFHFAVSSVKWKCEVVCHTEKDECVRVRVSCVVLWRTIALTIHYILSSRHSGGSGRNVGIVMIGL